MSGSDRDAAGSHPVLRGKRGRERRVAERIVAEYAARMEDAADEVDFDIAEVEVEAADARVSPPSTGRRPPSRPQPAPTHPPISRPSRAGRRLPDLSALPPLLAATGSFAALRERLGQPTDRPPVEGAGHHGGVVSVPHGAKTYLAAALAIGAAERVCWIARDAEIGDRVAEELGAWLGDPDAVAVLEPRTSLAYERSERSWPTRPRRASPRLRHGGAAGR
jgi:hypothetical protein